MTADFLRRMPSRFPDRIHFFELQQRVVVGESAVNVIFLRCFTGPFLSTGTDRYDFDSFGLEGRYVH